LLTRQQASLEKSRILTYSALSGGLLLGILIWLYFRYRYRLQKQSEAQRLEIAAWKASLDGEEKERRRLAKELHDNIGGRIATLKMWFGNIRNSMGKRWQEEQFEFDKALTLLDNTLTEVRNTAHHLMPELLLRLGLAEGIRIYCDNLQQASGITIKYQYLGYLKPLNEKTELLIYRCVQELVQNAVKHAQATFLHVQLTHFDKMLCITVEDNGKGMDVKKASQSTGMGLQSIRDSIQKLNGAFNITSSPGEGTTIEIEINTEVNALKSQSLPNQLTQ